MRKVDISTIEKILVVVCVVAIFLVPTVITFGVLWIFLLPQTFWERLVYVILAVCLAFIECLVIIALIIGISEE